MPREKPKRPASRKPDKRSRPVQLKEKEEPYFIVPKQEAPGCPIQRIEGVYSFLSGQGSKLYHRTNRVAARRIVRHGFKDSTNYYMEQRLHAGVWLSSVPLDFNKGATGQVLLQVSTDLEENELARYEWITSKEKGYREWLVPAAVVNPRMRVSVVRE
jgi:hypothetical protein